MRDIFSTLDICVFVCNVREQRVLKFTSDRRHLLAVVNKTSANTLQGLTLYVPQTDHDHQVQERVGLLFVSHRQPLVVFKIPG